MCIFNDFVCMIEWSKEDERRRKQNWSENPMLNIWCAPSTSLLSSLAPALAHAHLSHYVYVYNSVRCEMCVCMHLLPPHTMCEIIWTVLLRSLKVWAFRAYIESNCVLFCLLCVINFSCCDFFFLQHCAAAPALFFISHIFYYISWGSLNKSCLWMVRMS